MTERRLTSVTVSSLEATLIPTTQSSASVRLSQERSQESVPLRENGADVRVLLSTDRKRSGTKLKTSSRLLQISTSGLTILILPRKRLHAVTLPLETQNRESKSNASAMMWGKLILIN